MPSAPLLCALLLGLAASGSAETLDQRHDGGSAGSLQDAGAGSVEDAIGTWFPR